MITVTYFQSSTSLSASRLCAWKGRLEHASFPIALLSHVAGGLARHSKCHRRGDAIRGWSCKQQTQLKTPTLHMERGRRMGWPKRKYRREGVEGAIDCVCLDLNGHGVSGWA